MTAMVFHAESEVDILIERACRRVGVDPDNCDWTPGAYGSWDFRIDGLMIGQYAAETIYPLDLDCPDLLDLRIERCRAKLRSGAS